MTLKQAIELLKSHKGTQYIKEPGEFGRALQLGIEALKWVKRYRTKNWVLRWGPLPGEDQP